MVDVGRFAPHAEFLCQTNRRFVANVDYCRDSVKSAVGECMLQQGTGRFEGKPLPPKIRVHEVAETARLWV